jgi:hypothetical protein
MKRFFRLPTNENGKQLAIQKVVDEIVHISNSTQNLGERVLVVEIRAIEQDQILIPLLEYKEIR